ncbi:MAG: CubicO group peptidase (beta-lactamase class C family) [Sediminicola sp.]|jgi:CubicO group peptidase (beta-lactamase class C family)
MNMKSNLFILLSLFLLQSCVETPDVDPTIDMIKKVEKGLTTPIYIEGDATWTVDERMEHYGVPGVSLAVINNGKIEWTKSYGFVDKERKSPVTGKTLFQAASISKPVTAYGVLTLVEQKKVVLNEDINTYLKSWKLPESEFTQDKKVTLKNLISHSAGITVHGFLGYSPDLPVPTLVEVLNGTPPANSGASVVDKIPEESFRYSGGGYNIVQQMMIDVEGKTFPEIMNELVLQPLEMNKSTFSQPLTGEKLALAATGYLPDGSMVKGRRHTYPEMAPAGLWTNAGDLAKFAVNIQATLKDNSTKGLSKDMTTKMLTPFVEEFSGLGIFLNKKKDEIYFGHGGWNEGFSSEMMAHKDKGYGVVVMINANQPDFISELIRSVALAYNWDDYVPIHKRMEIDPPIIAEISGRYLVYNNLPLEVLEKDKLLMLKNEMTGESMELVKISDSTYVSRESDQLIQFKPNSENTTINMLRINARDGAIVSSIAKMDSDTKFPVDYLLEGNFDGAMKAYSTLMQQAPNDPVINENNLNVLGYNFLNQDKTKLAQDIFKVNMTLYPDSFNVYDSYAEACMKTGAIDLAILNYNKSLNLNPENSNAKEMLKELQER